MRPADNHFYVGVKLMCGLNDSWLTSQRKRDHTGCDIFSLGERLDLACSAGL